MWQGCLLRLWPRLGASGADDSDPDRCTGVARDRLHRHEEGLSVAGLAGPGGSASRPAQRSSVLLPWASRQCAEGDLARWSGRMPVHKAPGAGPLPVAEPGRWRCDDLLGSVRLSSIRHRLETPTADVAADIGRMMFWLVYANG